MTDDAVPFDFSIETTTWTFPNGDKITLEVNSNGYLLSGRINGFDLHDEDHEDFFFEDSDSLLEFLSKHKLIGKLAKPTEVPQR